MGETERTSNDFECMLARIERLEHRVTTIGTSVTQDTPVPAYLLILLMAGALGLLYLGMGFPNHYYQPVFAIAILLVAYFRNSEVEKFDFTTVTLLLINLAVLTLALKVVIGGGDPRPLSWLKFPVITGNLLNLQVSWLDSAASAFTIPLTVIQSFFVLLTWAGCVVGLELLAGLSAFVLALFAVPQLVTFQWEVALLGLILAGVGLFLQFGGQRVKP